MTLTTKTIEVHLCDYCSSETRQQCLTCLKDLCWDCIREKNLEFQHAISFSGSLDGIFCSECQKDTAVIDSPVYKAYLAVQKLREEYQVFIKDFKARQKLAEATVQKHYRELRRN